MACACSVCLLAARFEEAMTTATPETQQLLRDVWDRLEAAETDAAWLRAHLAGTWPSFDNSAVF